MHDDDDDTNENEGELTLIPENASEFAARLVDGLKEDGISLDFSVQSLRTIDDILEEYHQEEAEFEEIEGMLFFVGCYVGEVIVRNNPGARWDLLPEGESESDLETGLIVQLNESTILNPIGKVVKRFQNGEEDSLAYFYTALVERLGA